MIPLRLPRQDYKERDLVRELKTLSVVKPLSPGWLKAEDRFLTYIGLTAIKTQLRYLPIYYSVGQEARQ